ncbi:hypothetical protein [Streptomyces phaeolivaceus]|nr:hypothetical protein [Streptomyces phaeolivaceus]
MSWSIESARTMVAVESVAFWAHRNCTLPVVEEAATVAQIWKAT